MVKNEHNHVKSSSISNILEIIRLEGMISRVEIAEKLELTTASISKLTKKLILKQFVVEERSEKKINGAGRPKILLKLNSKIGYLIGVYLAPEKIQVLLSDLNLEIIKRDSQPIKKVGKNEILMQLHSMLDAMISKLPNEKIFGIGVAMNGMVDPVEGISIFSPHYNWQNFSLKKELEKKYKLPVIMDNDVRVMALGEMKFGAAKGQNDFVLINIANGIGSGIVIDGRLHRGVNFSAGELGHLIVDSTIEERCSCGSKGCLELVASNLAVVKRAKSKFESESGSKYLLDKGDSLSVEDICRAAGEGDRLAREVIEETAWYIALGIRHLINLLNPGMIVLVSKLNTCGDLFYKELGRLIKENALIDPIRKISIKPSLLEDDAATVGAATLVLENLFKGIEIVKV